MSQKPTKLGAVDIEYRRLCERELRLALQTGDSDRAASFAKALAKLRRKEIRLETQNGD